MAENNKDYSKKFFTIPNIICLARIAMIPFFALFYCQGVQLASKSHMVAALVVLILSGISDNIDGRIARKYNMVSEVGKLLDPTADKLTQITLAVLMYLTFQGSGNTWMQHFGWVFLLFLLKEALMLVMGFTLLLLKIVPNPAAIYGKVATFVFYVTMALLFLAGPDVGILQLWNLSLSLPPLFVKIAVVVNLILTFTALFSYIPDTFRKLTRRTK
ncbi:MAG: CDP-alcohol phosphatidyltransferase family protein [Oscillospiraceae bacterium]|jgi:cardiolipin synthase|nr:CDP-alcohol phosphatidyltransferase family protein [Oscillospiraceae bacterium]